VTHQDSERPTDEYIHVTEDRRGTVQYMEVRGNTTPVAKKPTKMPGYFSELNSYCYLTCVALGVRATTQMQQLQLPGIELWTMVEGIKRSYVLRCSKLWRERRRAMNPRPA